MFSLLSFNIFYNFFCIKIRILPTNKIVRITEFENKALDELFKTYDEAEIVVETKNIPRIKYSWMDGSEHYYFPDIYIPKDNLIIEVKSPYTGLKEFEKNQRKAVVTKKAGYNFKLMTMN